MMFALLFRKDPAKPHSPAAMQEGYMQWKNWMTKYSKEILEHSPPRSGPKPNGSVAVCRGTTVTDGPYAENKEIVGGWTFIDVASFEAATTIAKEVPMFDSIEIIELATF